MPESQPFPAAYVRFVPPVRAKCRRLLGSASEVEEIVQETFLRFWQSGPDAGTAVDARVALSWLYRTCTRLAIDTLRRRRRDGGHSWPDADPFDVPCGLALEEAIAAKQLVLMVANGAPTDALEAAILCRVDGLSQPEAARVLDVSERTIRRLLERFDAHLIDWKKEMES